METIQITHEDVAEKLLFSIWQSIDAGFKQKYKADTWQVFENFVKSCACNENLKLFFEKIKRLIPYNYHSQFQDAILEVLQCGQDEIILAYLRGETSYMVLLTRALNEVKKDVFKEKHDKQEKLKQQQQSLI